LVRVENDKFLDDTYFSVELNIPEVFNLIKSCTPKKFKKKDRVQFNSICLNTNYVANYMINQYRIKDPIERRHIIPKCDLRDEEGFSVFGYEEKNGKMFQSQNVKQYI